MSTMTLYWACAACFVGGIAAGAFVGWLLGHEDGIDDGIRMANGQKGWSM